MGNACVAGVGNAWLMRHGAIFWRWCCPVDADVRGEIRHGENRCFGSNGVCCHPRQKQPIWATRWPKEEKSGDTASSRREAPSSADWHSSRGGRAPSHGSHSKPAARHLSARLRPRLVSPHARRRRRAPAPRSSSHARRMRGAKRTIPHQRHPNQDLEQQCQLAQDQARSPRQG